MRGRIVVALLAASCSYSEETAQISVTVDNIPSNADHLDVVVTPSDTKVAGKNCPSTLTPAPASNATCYRPSFQPGALNPPSMDLAFVQPSAATTTVTVDVTASDRSLTPLAHGSTIVPLPEPVTLHVLLK